MDGSGCRILTATAVLAILLVLSPPHPPAAEATSICGSSSSAGRSLSTTYQANLQQLTATLPANTSSSPTLFGTAIVSNGTPNQTVYAMALCRGDLATSSCLVCVRSSLADALLACPSSVEVTIDYSDSCHVRFSDTNFLSSTANVELLPFFSNFPSVAPSLAGRFNGLVARLLNATADYALAAAGGGEEAQRIRWFATGEMDVDGGEYNIFATAQCTPDLTRGECRECLEGALAEMPAQVFPHNSTGGSFVGDRCGLRLAKYCFYNGDAMVHLQIAGRPQGQGKRTKRSLVLIILLAILGGIIALTLIGFSIWKKRRSPRKESLFVNVEDMESFESIFIDLPTLRKATSNFDERNKLGEGGYGAVYKGALLDGQEVAIKRLSETTRQGLSQMKNELALLVKLQHKNLVRIIGICLEEGEHLLVYEYMPNKSLDTIIFDPDKSWQLDWGARFRIINGIARGLQYLHEHSQMMIVHRDLKASNILLDADMKPKIADFGLAKIFDDNQSRQATSRIIGTLGYMSPEYAMRGQYSTKLDVFSFGVLVLEIVTGRRNNYAVNSEYSPDLFCLVWKHWVEGTITQIADPSLGRHFPMAEVLKCVNIGLLCIQPSPADRPSMSAIVLMLGSNTVTVEAPYRPAFVDRSSSYSEMTVEVVKEKEELSSEPHTSITELVPR